MNLYLLKSIERMPMSTNDWADVVSAVTDGESLLKNAHPKNPTPIENVYAFYLDENNNLINITGGARTKLRKEIPP